MSSNTEIESPPIVSPTARLTLGLQGNFVPAPRPVLGILPPINDAFFRLELVVYKLRSPSSPPDPSSSSSSTTTIQTYDRYEYPSLGFSLSVLGDLRDLIIVTVTSAGHSAIGRYDDEAFEFLTDHITAFIGELLAMRFPVPEGARAGYLIHALLVVADEEPGSGPREEGTEAAPASTFGLLRKVTYRNEEEKAAAERIMVNERSCPICLQDFVDGEEVHLTPCAHPFHLRCLERWLQRKAECPLCRSSMSHIYISN